MMIDKPPVRERKPACTCKHKWAEHKFTGGCVEGCICPLNQAGQGVMVRKMIPYKETGMIVYDPKIENELGVKYEPEPVRLEPPSKSSKTRTSKKRRGK